MTFPTRLLTPRSVIPAQAGIQVGLSRNLRVIDLLQIQHWILESSPRMTGGRVASGLYNFHFWALLVTARQLRRAHRLRQNTSVATIGSIIPASARVARAPLGCAGRCSIDLDHSPSHRPGLDPGSGFPPLDGEGLRVGCMGCVLRWFSLVTFLRLDELLGFIVVCAQKNLSPPFQPM